MLVMENVPHLIRVLSWSRWEKATRFLPKLVIFVNKCKFADYLGRAAAGMASCMSFFRMAMAAASVDEPKPHPLTRELVALFLITMPDHDASFTAQQRSIDGWEGAPCIGVTSTCGHYQ